MNINQLNPFKALSQAWDEVEREYADQPDGDAPDDVQRARQSVAGLRDLKASFSHITREKARLKARGQ